jgi:hypothetical protein
MRLSLKESRMTLLNATNLDRKSGIRGPKTMGEAQPQPFAPDPRLGQVVYDANENKAFKVRNE